MRIKLALVATGLMLAWTGSLSPARADILDKCNALPSKNAVIQCCTRWIKHHDKPLWMGQANLTCKTVPVVCIPRVSRSKINSCSPQIPPDTTNSNGTPPAPQRVSDLRLKHDVHRVGTTVFGLPLYDFSYIGKPGVFEGVMAQDVLKVMPEAVTVGPNGFYLVNYAMLGIEMKQIAQ